MGKEQVEKEFWMTAGSAGTRSAVEWGRTKGWGQEEILGGWEGILEPAHHQLLPEVTLKGCQALRDLE